MFNNDFFNYILIKPTKRGVFMDFAPDITAACVCHRVYSRIQNAKRAEAGFFSSWRDCVESVNRPIRNIKLFKEKTTAQVLEDLERTGVWKNLELKQKGNKYVFRVGKCLLTKYGFHDGMKPLDAPCPLALFICEIVGRQNPSKKIYIYPTVYEEAGTVTEFELLSRKEYGEKLNELITLSKMEKTLQTLENLKRIKGHLLSPIHP